MTEGVVIKEGALELYSKKIGSKSWKSVFVCVTGGGLHVHKHKSKAPVSFDIEHCILDKHPANIEGKSNAFGLRTSSKYIVLAAASDAELLEWLDAFKGAFGKKMTYPEQLLRKEVRARQNTDLLFRAKKNISGKMATSSIVKQKVLNEDTRALLGALVSIVRAVVDEKTACEVERQVIKIVLKGYFQLENGTISIEKDIKPVDQLLRQAFNQVDKLFGYYQVRTTAQLAAGFTKAAAGLRAVSAAIIKIMEPHVRPDNIAKMLSVLNLLSDESFLVRIWENPGVEQDLLALVSAMNKYTMFEL
jgi:hypothetical protein